ncbi:hypothetical protein EXU48_00085 [Occultella glacieicola]|uniref:Uncharacterized protein n=1 Tax=Occultella glacieicola TaxID=2518684 RepID=A0ABY2E841_9MICO|nr:hypothetical protein [Occultella glacieicola]TDE98657.1 hypothetical protein EXU48_00085 [Occultella glacieicola]
MSIRAERTASEPDVLAQIRLLQELVTAMAVGLDPYVIQGLSFAQKELLADIVDAQHAALDRADGIEPGHPLAYEPEPRWWHESALPPVPAASRVG